MAAAMLDRIPSLLLAAALTFSAAVGVKAQVELSASELRKAAVLALRAGEPAKARRFGQALVARDGDDLNAHLIVARAARDMGDFAPARKAAQAAWQLSETSAEKYSAALITAQVLASDNKRTRAQLWLRRAVENAPSEPLRRRAQRDFGYVKQRNPWRTDLTFTLAPNSNINNGSANDSYRDDVFFGVPVDLFLNGDAQAIAGLEIGASVRTRYRFHETPTTAHDAKLSLAYRTYHITDDVVNTDLFTGETTPSDLTGSDFAYGSIGLGYGYSRRNMERKGELTFDTELGQSWYGGDRYASYLRAQAQQSIRLKDTRRMRFGADVERLWGQNTHDVDTLGVSAGLTEAFANGNSGFLGLSARTTQSVNAPSEYSEVSLRTGLALRKPVMGAALQFGLGVSWRDYDVARQTLDGRQDRRVFADVTATFKEIDYYGFNPTVTLSASSTDSNIGLYDVNRVGLNIGIRSAF